jgi:hypothetical protein
MKTIFLIVVLAVASGSPAFAGWHSLASFQGRESQVTSYYTFAKPWRVKWECRTRGSDFLFFSLLAVSAESPSKQFLLANEVERKSTTSKILPPGNYRFETIAAITWYQFQVEEWDGSRIWTSVDGREVEAEYISATDTHVKIRRSSDKQVFDYEIDKLSRADQAWIGLLRGY